MIAKEWTQQACLSYFPTTVLIVQVQSSCLDVKRNNLNGMQQSITRSIPKGSVRESTKPVFSAQIEWSMYVQEMGLMVDHQVSLGGRRKMVLSPANTWRDTVNISGFFKMLINKSGESLVP